jgi:hypothetical protein
MNKSDLTTKLATTEASLKRWQTRLKRAATKVHELDKQRRRYLLSLDAVDRPVVATVKVRVPVETDHLSEAEFAKMAKSKRQQKLTSSPVEKSTIDVAEVKRQLNAAITSPQGVAAIVKAAHEDSPLDLTIPKELDRRIPAIAEQMTAARKKAEATARSAMPLSGKAAMAKIRSKK